jgi:hypothetical protein
MGESAAEGRQTRRNGVGGQGQSWCCKGTSQNTKPHHQTSPPKYIGHRILIYTDSLLGIS